MITKKAFKLGASVCIKAPKGAAFPIVDPIRLKEYIQSKGMCASSIGTGLAVAYEQLIMTSKDKDIRDRVIERLMRQCDLGAQLDCPVVIGSMRGNIGPDDTYEEVLELIDQVGSSHLKVHLDTFHMNIEELDWEKPVLACGDKLGHVHIADNTRLYPGSGLIDFMPFLRALKKIGYDRSLIFEIYPGEDGYQSCILGRDYLMERFAQL